MGQQTMSTAADRTATRFDTRVEAALSGMEALRATLERKLKEVDALTLEQLRVPEMSALQRDLGKAITLAITEEGRAADARRIERGGDGLDLGAARAEIERRLAGIRRGAGEESVS